MPSFCGGRGSQVTAVRGRSILLTGAAGGLGTAIASSLAERHARLLLVDVDAGALRTLGDRLGCATMVVDVADAGDRGALIAHCDATGHEPDVLINGAGIEKASEYAGLDVAEIRHAMEVNLLAAMLLTREVLGGMRERRRGHVVSISSMAGIKAIPYNAVYNTAKAGLIAFSTSLSKELVGTGVHATVICPTAVRGVGMWARVSDQLSPNRLVDSSVVRPQAVTDAVLRALERRPRRILVGAPVVRAGALLSAMSPSIDRATDRVSRIGAVYRERIRTDADRRL
jgi:short-subunit dehydrogenase